MFEISICAVLVSLSIFSLCEAIFRPIVNGEDTKITEVPYTAYVEAFKNEEVSSRGGGVIIAEKTVLSAAHVCRFWEDATSMTVHIGSADRTKGGENILVDNVIIHPEYNVDTQDYDYCIMNLKTPITFDETKKPVQLPNYNTEISNGELLLASGWGGTLNDDKSDRLQKVILPKISNEECQPYYTGKVTERMFCAMNPDSIAKTFEGDSGGPIVSLNDHKLYGVVSWGTGNETGHAPDVYAKVSFVVDWIQEYIN